MILSSINHDKSKRASFCVASYNLSKSEQQSHEFEKKPTSNNKILTFQNNKLKFFILLFNYNLNNNKIKNFSYLNEIPTETIVKNLSYNNIVLGNKKPKNLRHSSVASHQVPLRRSSGSISKKINIKLFFNIIKALIVRALFIAHSLTTIWATVKVRNDSSLWAFSLISSLVAVEGACTIILRDGNEKKWFFFYNFNVILKLILGFLQVFCYIFLLLLHLYIY